MTTRNAVIAFGLLLGLVIPANAPAAVVVGKLAESLNEACQQPNSPSVQDATAPGIPSYAMPAGGGVITKWSHASRGIAGSLLKLRVYRRVAPRTYLIVGESEFRGFDENGPIGYPARVAVGGGDLLGIVSAPNAATAPISCFENGDPGDVVFESSADFPPNQSGFYGVGPGVARLNIAALVEADADRDGFGDETQDACPSNPLAQGACPPAPPAPLPASSAAVPPAPVGTQPQPAAKKKKCKKVTVKRAGKKKKVCKKKRKRKKRK